MFKKTNFKRIPGTADVTYDMVSSVKKKKSSEEIQNEIDSVNNQIKL